MDEEPLVRIEWAGVGLSLALLAAGIAELADAIDLVPVGVYLAVLWLVALGLWLLRRTG